MSRLHVPPASPARGPLADAPLPIRTCMSRSWRRPAIAVPFGALAILLLVLVGLALRPGGADAVAFAEPAPAVFAALPAPEPPRSRGFAAGIAFASRPIHTGASAPAAKPEAPPQQLPVAAVSAGSEPTPPINPAPPLRKVMAAESAPMQIAAPVIRQCGTSVDFYTDPRQAARKAADDKRLVFTVHVSGDFDDPGFT